jgi:hypothetical protein
MVQSQTKRLKQHTAIQSDMRRLFKTSATRKANSRLCDPLSRGSQAL